MDKTKKLKSFIKTMPLLGKAAVRIYGMVNFIKPGGQYWEYEFKAKKFDKFIRNIVLLIGNKEYNVVVNGNGDVYITLKNGIKFYWIPKNPFSLLGMPLRGTFEPECTFCVSKIIKKGDIVFDIGGNFGWYSCHLAQLIGETGKVHVFEPTNAIDELGKNLILNGFKARCILKKVALGAKKGTETLFIPQKLGTAFASLREHSYGDSDKVETDKVNVPIEKLDDYVNVNQIKKVDFIKMDIEGAEYLALKGAENVLKQYSPVIMLELQSVHTKLFGYAPEELINYLENLGYHLYEIDEKEFGLLKKVASFNSTSNYNFLAMKNIDILKTTEISIK